jgi:hypothetical protein
MKEIAVLIVGLMLFSCQMKKQEVDPPPVRIQAEQAAAKIQKTADNCYCMPDCSGCETDPYFQVARHFIKTGCQAVYTVTWTGCFTSASTSDPKCNTKIADTSTLTLCFSSCSSVTANFQGHPECLPCMPNDFCIQLTPQQEGSNTYGLIGSYMGDPSTQVNITVAISTDPDVSVTCVTNPAFSYSVSYTCKGSF